MKNFARIVLTIIVSFTVTLISFGNTRKGFAYQHEEEQTSGESSEETFLSFFASDYFINLDENAAYNKRGSCGYVAIASLLSFYDTYWNDAIIPESYDQISTALNVSPGIKNERLAFESITDAQYDEAVFDNDNINTYFQFLLFKLRRQATNNTSNTMSYGVNYTSMCEMINYYLFTYLGLTTSACSVNTVISNVEQFVANYVSQGIPVIVGIPGHVTVAYDYDSENNELYGYWGYGASNNHKKYTSFSDAYAIVLNMDHFHSNNYIIEGETFCACKLDSHIHQFGNQTNIHLNVCYCGISKCGGVMRKVYRNTSSHEIVCSCGYEGVQPHSFNLANSYYIGAILYNDCLGCHAAVAVKSGFGEVGIG